MKKVSVTELTSMLKDTEFMDGIKTISVIHNHNNPLEFAVYFDDLVCMSGLESEVNINITGCDVSDWERFQLALRKLSDVLVFEYRDIELTDAWKQSYTNGGITEDRWDRRTIFHPFNEPNEMFVVDFVDYHQIKGDDERLCNHIPNWKKGAVDWFKNKMIGGEI